MNSVYNDAWKPQNRNYASIDDEEFCDIYIYCFEQLVVGNFAEEDYQELYQYLVKELVKQWIVLLYDNDNNNTIFDAYFDFCDKEGKDCPKRCKENIQIIINDSDFIDEIVCDAIDNDKINELIEEGLILGGH